MMTSPPLLILTNDAQGVFQQLVIAGVQEIAAERGHRVEVMTLHPQQSPRLERHQVAGVLAIANAAAPALLHQCYQQGIPVSLVAHHLPDLPIPGVMFNNVQGVQTLVRHLVEGCGRERLLFIAGIADQIDGQQREWAFRREMMRYNLADWQMLPGEFEPEIAAAALRQKLAQGLPVDGILAADYRMAIAAVATLRAAGWRVPQQVAVVGFGDAPEAAQAEVTTVAADVQELGRRSALQLLCQMDGLAVRGITRLSVNLIERSSSRP